MVWCSVDVLWYVFRADAVWLVFVFVHWSLQCVLSCLCVVCV